MYVEGMMTIINIIKFEWLFKKAMYKKNYNIKKYKKSTWLWVSYK